jgi:hypothetical protein
MEWNLGILERRRMLPSLLVMLVLLGSGHAVAQGGSGQDSDGGAVAMGPQGRMVRGTVASATADGLTVKTENGETFQVVVTANTRVVKLADIHPGDGVGAMGVIDAPTKTVHAAVLFVVDAAQIKKAREDLGKTYITGKVAAIDDVNLTIERPDGVSQKITVDESTSFRKGGRRMRGGDGFGGGMGEGGGQGQGAPAQAANPAESITLADVKVGDRVMGRGALKGGVFVPTELVVMEPGMGRRRGQGSGDAPAPGATAAPAPAAQPK